ncbi:hypothetical protein BDY24DRAFT_26264 [Mrakia frigida]|uniref:uncharacterized protein n=1 Tax=Mrakia frigida TaxID=29902 RepID=UPI003FCC1533
MAFLGRRGVLLTAFSFPSLLPRRVVLLFTLSDTKLPPYSSGPLQVSLRMVPVEMYLPLRLQEMLPRSLSDTTTIRNPFPPPPLFFLLDLRTTMVPSTVRSELIDDHLLRLANQILRS